MTRASETSMSKDEPLLSNCPLETAEPSRNYAREPGYKKKYKKKTRKFLLFPFSFVLLVIREVPRSADYEYEYVWVSRILTR